MHYKTDDVRIKEIKELVPPSHVLREFGITDAAAKTVVEARQQIHRVLHGADDRLVVIAGPCSIHDVKAAKEFASRLADARQKLGRELLIVMRVYFEKPRTTVGWKGLINDPNLDGSFSINEGLRIARRLLLDVNETGVPVGCEFLDMITPQYIGDLVAGARSARARPKARCTASSRRACRVRSASRTAPTATSALRSMQYAPLRRPTTSSR
jgi:3-deoxy-7-phosphoheptulonate synthase